MVVTDNLPELKRPSTTLTAAVACTAHPGSCVCNLGDMEVGQTKTFFVYVTIKGSKGDVSNTATVVSQTVDLIAGQQLQHEDRVGQGRQAMS